MLPNKPLFVSYYGKKNKIGFHDASVLKENRNRGYPCLVYKLSLAKHGRYQLLPTTERLGDPLLSTACLLF